MTSPTRSEMERMLLEFAEAFNRNDLDAVMRTFTEDAVYQTYDGVRHAGKAAIRAELEPQFHGRYGRLLFRDEDLIVDAEQQRAVLRWVCEHDLRTASRPWQLLRVPFGDHPGWQGLDVFYLDGLLIREKHTFARTLVPRMRRAPVPEPWRGDIPLPGGEVPPGPASARAGS